MLFKKAEDRAANISTPAKALTSCKDRGLKITSHHGQSLRYAAQHHNEQVQQKRSQVLVSLARQIE